MKKKKLEAGEMAQRLRGKLFLQGPKFSSQHSDQDALQPLDNSSSGILIHNHINDPTPNTHIKKKSLKEK